MQLYLNTLYVIANTDKNIAFIEAIFKMKLLVLLGFAPRVEKCCICGEKEITHFSLKDSGVKCTSCSRQDTGAIQISPSTWQALCYIVLSPAKKLYSFEISEENQKQLEIIAKLYMNDKLEKNY